MASVVVEEVISKYVLDSSRYKSGAQDVLKASQSIAKNNNQTGISFTKLASGFKAAGAGFTAIAVIIAAELAFVKQEAELVGEAMQKAAAFESLTSSLEAVEGSADKARRSIARLKDLAKAPGLGLQEATTGYLRLRRADMGREESFRAVAAAGKANALSGGTKENLDRVLLAMAQIASKANVSQEEILQLTEAGVNAGKALKDAFGTADTEQLKKMGITSKQALEAIVASFEALPSKASGAQNAFDNLGDSIDFATIAIGQSFNDAFMNSITNFGDVVGELTNRGVFKAAADMVADSFGNIADSLGGSFKDTILSAAAALVVFNEYVSMMANVVLNIAKTVLRVIPFLGRLVDLMPTNVVQGGGPFARFEEILKMLRLQDEAGRKRSEAQAKKDKEADARDKAKESQDTLGGIKTKNPVLDDLVKNSKRTADNTEKIANIQDQVLGGGSLGGRGLSRQELSDIQTGRGASGTREIKTILVELGVAIERGMSRTAARAIGNNVSRREV